MSGQADGKAVRDILQLEASEPLQGDVQDVDDGTVHRALLHYRGNVHKAAEHIRKWLSWRKEFAPSSLDPVDISYEISTRQAIWHGRDKLNRPCLYISPHLHNPLRTRGSGDTFRKYMVHMVEQGRLLVNEASHYQFCVVYDRRWLLWRHIDTSLYITSRELIRHLMMYYANMCGTLYIVHMNCILRCLYQSCGRPFIECLAPKNSIVVTQSAEGTISLYFNCFKIVELLQYFDESELPPNFLECGIQSNECIDSSGDGSSDEESCDSEDALIVDRV